MLQKIVICAFSLLLFSCNSDENNNATEEPIVIPKPDLPTTFTPKKWDKGTGTINDPYQIETVEHLVFLSETVNEPNLTGEIADQRKFLNKYFKIINNLDLKGINFIPIGRNTHFRFGGNLDGNFKTISNLTIKTTIDSDSSGLFGENGGSIKNLSIINADIEGLDYVGGFIGQVSGGPKIENCIFNGTIKGNSFVGGLVGNLSGNATQFKITNCIFYGKIIGKQNVGGIIGSTNTLFEATQCINYGDIEGLTNVGGIVGDLDNSFIGQCYNKGKISAGIMNAGGIAGTSSWSSFLYSKNRIENCYNKGDVFSPKNAAGILGSQGPTNLLNTYNTGKITPSDGQSSAPIISGYYETFNVDYCYFLNTSIGKLIDKSRGIIKEQSYMQTISFVNELNSNVNSTSIWKQDKTPNINDGYPILSWQ